MRARENPMRLFFSPTSPGGRKCLAVATELGRAARITLRPSQARLVKPDLSVPPGRRQASPAR